LEVRRTDARSFSFETLAGVLNGEFCPDALLTADEMVRSVDQIQGFELQVTTFHQNAVEA